MGDKNERQNEICWITDEVQSTIDDWGLKRTQSCVYGNVGGFDLCRRQLTVNF